MRGHLCLDEVGKTGGPRGPPEISIPLIGNRPFRSSAAGARARNRDRPAVAFRNFHPAFRGLYDSPQPQVIGKPTTWH
jgi:hypothetical protein